MNIVLLLSLVGYLLISLMNIILLLSLVKNTSTLCRLMVQGDAGGGSGAYKKLAAGGAHDLMLHVGGVDEENGGIQLSDLNNNQTPAWVADADAVETCLADIQRHTVDLQSMHAQRVGSVFGRDLEDMELLIERKTADVTEQFRHAERLLQRVGVVTRRAGGQEATVGANVQRR